MTLLEIPSKISHHCRFIQYKPTSLERTFKYDLLTEHDLGVTIDLINPDTYKSSDNGKCLFIGETRFIFILLTKVDECFHLIEKAYILQFKSFNAVYHVRKVG